MDRILRCMVTRDSTVLLMMTWLGGMQRKMAVIRADRKLTVTTEGVKGAVYCCSPVRVVYISLVALESS